MTSREQIGRAIRIPLEILLGIFIILKISGFITWSWWWVTSPFWIPAGIILIFLIIKTRFFIRDIKKAGEDNGR